MKEFDLNLFSIGHSNHTPDFFLDLLNEFKIKLLVDVRSSPYSKFHTHFNKENLSNFLKKNGIDYKWMGDSLGGRRDDLISEMGYRQDHVYNDDALYRQGIVELMRLSLKQTTVMMCSEEDPRNCHRHKIISNTIVHRKIDECNKLREIHIQHIRGDGDIEQAIDIPTSFQPKLF